MFDFIAQEWDHVLNLNSRKAMHYVARARKQTYVLVSAIRVGCPQDTFLIAPALSHMP